MLRGQFTAAGPTAAPSSFPKMFCFRPRLRPQVHRSLWQRGSTWQRHAASLYTDTAPWNTQAKKKAASWSSPYKLLIGFMPIFTFGLGTWQMYRLKWKLGLIEELEDQVAKDPMDLPRIIK